MLTRVHPVVVDAKHAENTLRVVRVAGAYAVRTATDATHLVYFAMMHIALAGVLAVVHHLYAILLCSRVFPPPACNVGAVLRAWLCQRADALVRASALLQRACAGRQNLAHTLPFPGLLVRP